MREETVNLNLDNLPIQEVFIWKYISVEASEVDRLRGYIHYKRFLDDEYEAPYSDILDEIIINCILKVYPNARIEYNKVCSSVIERDKLKNKYKGEIRIQFEMTFSEEFHISNMYLPNKAQMKSRIIKLPFTLQICGKIPSFEDIISHSSIVVAPVVGNEFFKKIASLV